ncbi:MAG: DJ-1 family glyoxalase III [Lawsonibacter sp.]|jgi:4-methyl-5(b-hydroxyethyl)-thiazole monophosphate biosynthesis
MVYILLAPGFEEAEALVPADLLRRAGRSVSLVALEGEFVTGSNRIVVKADVPLSQVDLTQAEMVVLPGGRRGVEQLSRHPGVAGLIQEAADREIYVAAICAAPTLLGALGHLKGRKAVCYPGMEDGLTGAIPCPDKQVVTDGKWITGQAAGASFAFGLKLVETLAGPEKAEEVRNAVHYR